MFWPFWLCSIQSLQQAKLLWVPGSGHGCFSGWNSCLFPSNSLFVKHFPVEHREDFLESRLFGLHLSLCRGFNAAAYPRLYPSLHVFLTCTSSRDHTREKDHTTCMADFNSKSKLFVCREVFFPRTTGHSSLRILCNIFRSYILPFPSSSKTHPLSLSAQLHGFFFF